MIFVTRVLFGEIFPFSVVPDAEMPVAAIVVATGVEATTTVVNEWISPWAKTAFEPENTTTW